MIRAIAPLLMLLCLLASLPSGTAGANSPEPANAIDAATLADPAFRRADLTDATDDPDAGNGALDSVTGGVFTLTLLPMPSAVPPRRGSGPSQARAPPGRDVVA